MHDLLSPALSYDLALADGSRWAIAAADTGAAAVVTQLGDAMQLRAASDVAASSQPGLIRLRVGTVRKDSASSPQPAYDAFPSEDGGRCVNIYPTDPDDGIYLQLVRLALVFARDAQTRGGVLMHGALAEYEGGGVILAAPGGTGKTTASNRLPSPWRSWSDDATLVVRDAQGNYWAHPWPTWSRFVCRQAGGGTWDVQHAVPLKGIFLLSQASDDRVELIGRGQAVSLLIECAAQAGIFMGHGQPQAEQRALHLERFDNLCALVRTIPVSILHISLTGAFWEAIAQALDVDDHRYTEQVI